MMHVDHETVHKMHYYLDATKITIEYMAGRAMKEKTS